MADAAELTGIHIHDICQQRHFTRGTGDITQKESNEPKMPSPMKSASPKKAKRARSPSAGASPSAKRAKVSPAKKSKSASPSKKSSSSPGAKRFFLIKSEPFDRFETTPDGKKHNMKYSLDDLKGEKAGGAVFPGATAKDKQPQTAEWDGVRNFLARNHMRSMKKGDRALFYHSNAKKETGVVGVVEIVREAYPDEMQFDEGDPHYAPKATREKPMWDVVDIKFVRETKRLISLEELKADPNVGAGAKENASCPQAGGGKLEKGGMGLFRFARLSVQPVSQAEWNYVMWLEGQPGPAKPEKKPKAAKAGKASSSSSSSSKSPKKKK